MATLHNLCLAWIATLNAGCVIVLGDGTGSGASGGSDNGKASALPEPEDSRVDPPALTAEQQKKKDEADAYTASFIYQDRPIAKTVQGDSGTIYDYMTIPPLDIQVPDVLSLLPGAPPDGIQLGLTEVEKDPDLWGLSAPPCSSGRIFPSTSWKTRGHVHPGLGGQLPGTWCPGRSEPPLRGAQHPRGQPRRLRAHQRVQARGGEE